MGLALLISKVTTPLFMGIVYFIVLMPIGLVRRLSGKSPIVPPTRADTWVIWPSTCASSVSSVKVECQ